MISKKLPQMPAETLQAVELVHADERTATPRSSASTAAEAEKMPGVVPGRQAQGHQRKGLAPTELMAYAVLTERTVELAAGTCMSLRGRRKPVQMGRPCCPGMSRTQADHAKSSGCSSERRRSRTAAGIHELSGSGNSGRGEDPRLDAGYLRREHLLRTAGTEGRSRTRSGNH